MGYICDSVGLELVPISKLLGVYFFARILDFDIAVPVGANI